MTVLEAKEMPTIPYKRSFTVSEYYKMYQMGLFRNEKLELLEGEIFKMSPIGAKHSDCVDYLNSYLVYILYKEATIRVQEPIELSDNTEPEPDLVIAQKKRYKKKHPTPKDVYLIIEVSDSSYHYDREHKLPIYSQNGIPEVWIINVNENFVEQFSNPFQGKYHFYKKFMMGEAVESKVMKNIKLNLLELFEGET